jgi:adenylate cyclase
VEVRRLLDEALEADGNYAVAHTCVGWLHWEEAYNGWSADSELSLESALIAAERALTIDPSNPNTHALRAMVYLSLRRHDLALAESERAISLGPNNSNAIAGAATVAYFCDRPRQSLALLGRALRLCPIPPAWMPGEMGEAHWYVKQLDEAKRCCRKSVEIDPDYVHAQITLASSFIEAGRRDDAGAAAREVRKIEPNFTVGAYARRQPFRNEEVLARRINSLHAAGLPA